jgi:hypothetical protein
MRKQSHSSLAVDPIRVNRQLLASASRAESAVVARREFSACARSFLLARINRAHLIARQWISDFARGCENLSFAG